MSELNNKDYNEQIYKFLIEEILDKDAIFDLIYYKITGKYPDNDCSSVSKNKIDGYLKQFSENEDKMCAAKKTIEYYNLKYGKSDRIYPSNSVLDIIFKSESKCNLNNINSDFYKFLDFLSKNLRMRYKFIKNELSGYYYLSNGLPLSLMYNIYKFQIKESEFVEPSTKVKKDFIRKILTDEILKKELDYNIKIFDCPCVIFLEESREYLSQDIFDKKMVNNNRNGKRMKKDVKYETQIIDFNVLGLFHITIDTPKELEELLYMIINLPINLLKYIKLDLNLKEHIFKFSFTTSSDNNCIYIIENSGENSKKIGKFLCKKPIYNREEVIKIINNISKYTI